MIKLLFQFYPGLIDKISCFSLATLPTSVELFGARASSDDLRLPLLPNLWIKRDDQTNCTYGGNKVRKLEFILGELQQKKFSEVVTFGAIGTNHGVATSLFCQQLGIDCRIYLFDQPILQHDFYGEGYGVSTIAGEHATQLFKQISIDLEATYTAKAAALQSSRRDINKNVLYGHTFNSADIGHFLAEADVKSLPTSFRALAS